MFGYLLDTFLPEIIHLLEAIGVIIVTIGCLKTFAFYVISYFKKGNYHIKHKLGYALALGLEFKMGAEILKTVLIQDMGEIWMLGATIVLRGLLALLIHFEMKEESEQELV